MGAAPPQHERSQLSGSAKAKSVERRLLQAAAAVGCIVPLAAGGAGIWRGAALLKGVHAPLPVDLDSHFRYLSGLLFGIGLLLAFCVPTIERRGSLLRAIGLMVILGGLARLSSLIREGPPSAAHLGALGIELVAMPVLLLWLARVARLYGAAG